MSKSFRKDLTGQRFGRLEVISFFPNDKKDSYWQCKCDCGKIGIYKGNSLLRKNTQSCGCLKVEMAKTIQNQYIKKHGKRKTRLYNIWAKMRQRCFNKQNEAYNDYGGRGITVCDEWKADFQAFYDWAIANGYKDNLSIDRIDNDKDYTLQNCRWTDMKTQSRNRRSNISVKYNNQTICLQEAAELSGISINILRYRYRNGDRGERLFRSPE